MREHDVVRLAVVLLADEAGDRIAVLRLSGERAEYQHVEGALEEVETVGRHVSDYTINS